MIQKTYRNLSVVLVCLLSVLFTASIATGQEANTVTGISIQSGQLQPPQGFSGTAIGTSGGNTIYYWVVAHYSTGVGPSSGPMAVTNTAGIPNLSASNSVVLSWSPVTDAIGYTVYRSNSPDSPLIGNGCSNCGVLVNSMFTTVVDTNPVGLALSLPSSVQSATATFTIDVTSVYAPYVNTSFRGRNYRLALFGGAYNAGDCIQVAIDGSLQSTGAPCGTGSGSGITIRSNGVSLPSQPAVNFVSGTGVDYGCVNDAPNSQTVCTPTADTGFLATRANVSQGLDQTCIPASGSSTAYTCNPASGGPYPALVNGSRLMFRPDVNCGASPTLAVGGGPTQRLYASDGVSSPVCAAGLSYWIIRNASLDSGVGGWVFPATSLSANSEIFLPLGGGNFSGAGAFPGYIISGGAVASAGVDFVRLELSYNATTARTAVWDFRFPRRWAGGNVSVRVLPLRNGVDGTFELGASIVCIVGGVANPTYPANTTTGLVSFPAALNIIGQLTINSVPTAGCSPGSFARLRLQRTPGVGTATGTTVEVYGVSIDITEQ